MTPGTVIASAGSLKCVRGSNCIWLYDTSGPSLTTLTTLPLPAWRNPAPLATVKLCIAALRPSPPKLCLDAVSQFRRPGARYCPRSDRIEVFKRDKLPEQNLAELLLHELGHATGVETRSGRYRLADGVDELADTPAAKFVELDANGQQEESVADIASCLVAVRLGIEPRTVTHPGIWLPRAAVLPLEALRAAIADAKAAAAFILADDELQPSSP